MNIEPGTAAIVTGAASGLGYAAAKTLAAAGAKIAVFDMNENKGAAAAEEFGGIFCQTDVTSDASVDAAFEQARAAHGQERILINCAGGGTFGKTAARNKKTGDITRHSMKDFDWTVQLNLMGTFRCTTAAAAGMMTLDPLEDGERGVIINTASIAAEEGQIGQVAYAASKAAIAGMTITIARDLASEGIRINTILPGPFTTPPMLSVPDVVLENIAKSIPFPKRLGKPEEFGHLVETLVRNTYTNGQTYRIDGGVRLAPS